MLLLMCGLWFARWRKSITTEESSLQNWNTFCDSVSNSLHDCILLTKFHLQCFRSKLGVGLLSGKYSKPPPEVLEAKQTSEELQPGISPHMFKSLIGKGHPLFSSKRQQDAQEFFLHFINTLEVLYIVRRWDMSRLLCYASSSMGVIIILNSPLFCV